jgi:hypothetical protein
MFWLWKSSTASRSNCISVMVVGGGSHFGNTVKPKSSVLVWVGGPNLHPTMSTRAAQKEWKKEKALTTVNVHV